MSRRAAAIAAGVCVAVAASGAQAPDAPDPTLAPVWRTPQATVGTPAIDGHDVFALTADHSLIKLSLDDGSQLWRVETGEQGVTYGHALALTPQLVLVGEYDVVAFDRTTGRRAWKFSPTAGAAPGPYIGDVRDGLALTGSAAAFLHAVDANTGEVIWSTRVTPDDDATVYRPRIIGDTIVAGFTVHSAPARGGLVSVRMSDGRVRWRFDFPSGEHAAQMAGGPVEAADVVVASSTDGQVWAVDHRTGTVRWSLPPMSGALESIIPAGTQDYRSLGVIGPVLFVGSTTGYVLGYDMSTRQEVWRFAGGRLGSTAFSVAATGHLAVVPYVSGFLVAIDARTGQLRWRTHDWQHGFVWPPASAGGLLVASTRSGVWALRSAEGHEP